MAESLVDRHFLQKLERLTLEWQKSFHGLIGGHNLSRFAGPGQEFLEHRNFHNGDDLRAVNWRAYLRFEKLFLKMFQIEPRVPVRLLLDTSASMIAGSGAGEPTKFDYARKLAAALVYVGLVRLDSIVLQPFADHLLDRCVSSGGRHRFQPAENFLRALKAGGKTDFFEIARQYLSTYPQRGLTIVISDFLGEADWLRPLQYIADFGHELFLVHLWGEEDRSPAGDQDTELIDVETGARVRISLDREACEAYRRAFTDYSEGIKRLALRNGGRYAGLSVKTAIEDAMFGALATVDRFC